MWRQAGGTAYAGRDHMVENGDCGPFVACPVVRWRPYDQHAVFDVIAFDPGNIL